jgi:sulfhydrogenase subunit beta (sulfur reductase)
MEERPAAGGRGVISREGLVSLLEALCLDGYEVLGPTVRDGAIVYGRLAGIEDLPEGWTDRQEAGHYRLERRSDRALFGYTVGPHSWKQFLFPPIQRLWRARKKGQEFSVTAEKPAGTKYAFIGVRACELQAMSIQDNVFLGGPYRDSGYGARRESSFIVAVNCGQAAATCFCVSMQAGPKARSGFDLALTELLDGERHEFVVEAGTEAGRNMLRRLPAAIPSAAQLADADAVVRRTARQMGRQLDTNGLKALLQANPEHPRWTEVAERCLSCGNCTMVCPTCFCTTVEDHSDLAGTGAERVRKWDSCFTMDFSYIHGGSVRKTGSSRYRQWMTHKLSSWYDQFGTSGCVGCGRCITWCPVGIDITEEAAAIRADLREQEETDEGS